ncbi:formyltransferase family protein, partial [Xanthomonas sp. LMG 8992]|uniref:formyltransferase family protein n=1 Tax=Xanthomonas sp. LMG 8992 TaxID=1591157 RepID=UPI001927A6E0
MQTLRTPKHITSIDLGVPSLTFRAWWEAQYGSAAWDALDKIPRARWMDYLRWYRTTLRLPVRNATRVVRVEPHLAPGIHRLHLAMGAPLLARKLILATGIQGGGQWVVPEWISRALPAHRYSHTSSHIDFAALAGSYGIAFHHLPVSADTRAEQEAQLLALVDALQIDLVVLARYMQILSPQLCRALAGRAINIHH